jgi:uncharacterized protein
MSKTLQIEVNPSLCASQERTIIGELPYIEMIRIKGDVDSSTQPIAVDLMFSKVGKFVVLSGRISGNLVLQCAACLELMEFSVDIDVKLAIINDEALINLLPEGVEPYLLEGEQLLMSELVESELVLVMPSIARHEICPIELPKSSTSKGFVLEAGKNKNPFEVLEGLKRK